MPLPHLIFYTKPNCPLCDEALEELELARRTVSFEIEPVNILDDLAIYERYKHSIPVGTLDGAEVFRFRVTREMVIEGVQRLASSKGRGT